ncbi:hypothetical protein [Pantoea sp. CCBC3-3-1]|uniref:hypothetical protein n=1 Tax=Pantoea sp. CCBC3-3-1 TaxID=2490851 RepID=UPI0011BF9EC8|nr:hypothetical protein [Pantoea sp. CCBC3-3-1]
MSLEKGVIYTIVFLFFLLLILNLIAIILFKRKESEYEALLAEFRMQGFQIDSVTSMASNLGFLATYQKIIYFVRLYKGVRMYHTKGNLVHENAYLFIKKQDKNRIAWILKLHSLYRIIFSISALFFVLLILFVYFLN